MICEHEMCPFWSGTACVCSVFDIDAAERDLARRGIMPGSESDDA